MATAAFVSQGAGGTTPITYTLSPSSPVRGVIYKVVVQSTTALEVKIEVNGATVFLADMVSGAVTTFDFDAGLSGGAGESVVVTLGAGAGTTNLKRLNVLYDQKAGSC